MSEQNKRLISLLLFILYFTFFAKAQSDKVKVDYIHRCSELITWPNERQLSRFQIAMFSPSDSFAIAFEDLQFQTDIKEMPIELVTYTKISDISEPQILFVSKKHTGQLKKILHAIANKPVLLISDYAFSSSHSMLNFIRRSKKLGFEVNQELLKKHQFRFTPKLIFLSGEKVDLRELYLRSEAQLASERKKVEDQKRKLEKQATEMLYQKQQIGLQKISIDEQTVRLQKQKDSIIQQKDRIEDQSYDLEKQGHNLAQQNFDLQELFSAAQSQENALIEKAQLLFRQEQSLDSQRHKMIAFNKMLNEKEEKINLHKKRIFQKEEELEEQKTTTYIVLFLLSIFIFLVLLAFYAYFTKKRANAVLEEKNEEIARQRDESERNRSQLAQQHEQITASIRYATTIQLAMLPRPYEFEEFDHFILFQAKDMVSGDFYWMRTFDHKDITYHMIAAVDCTGHGVPGAFMSMIANRLLNEIVTVKQIIEPALVLDYLDRYVQGSLRQEVTDNRDGMDVALIRITEKKNGFRDVVFSGAKRPLIYFDAKKQAILRKKGSRRGIGGPKGNSKEEPFETVEMIMTSNDAVYLTSDGYIDQNNVARKRFGSKRFNELLLKIAEKNMPEQKQILEQELQAYQNGAAQRDDITVVGLRI